MSTLTGTRTHSASHSPPSLPSFAQAFSNINHAGASASMVNLAKISIARDNDQGTDMDTLPPIHNVEQNNSPDTDRQCEKAPEPRNGKKRSLDSDDHSHRQEHEARRSAEHENNVKRASSAVKREASLSPSPEVSQMELDQLDPSPSPPRRPAKKRRVNTAPGSKSQPSGDRDSPVSPVVAAFTVPSSDQGALEQVRAMLSIKQKQKEIIEQRRGSAAGLLQSTPNPAPSPRPAPLVRRQSGTSSNSASAATSSSQQHTSPQQQAAQPVTHPAPPHQFSPPQQSLAAPNNSFSNSRRRRGTLQTNGHGHTLPSESLHPLAQPPRLPPPILTPSSSTSHAFPQPPPPQSQTQGQHQLARTPAIAKSTTTRAAPPKPLTIAPHGHSRRLEPLVHSAPVIGGFGPVRVPELPPIPITPGGRRVSAGVLGAGANGGANIAIAKSGGMRTAGLGLGLGRLGLGSSSGVGTVPPTPAYASLSSQQQQPAASQDGKAGFLQLFENFYDSLADSRLLKQWLQEQLAKSNALLDQLGKLEKERESEGVSLAQVEDLIERRVAPMRNEMEGLRRRVGELEEMLYRERQRGAARRESFAINPEFEDDAKSQSRRGLVRLSDASGYVFPERRDESGDRDRDRERERERDRDRERERERGSPAASLHSSPSFDQRRLSTSAVRLESGPSHPHVHPVFPIPSSSSQHRPSPLGLERERERERDRDPSRAWDRRRPPAESSGTTHSSNGRHDTDRERERAPTSSITQPRAPSA